MFKGHPKGLIAAALSNMGERFGYYIMNAVLLLFLCSKFGLSDETSGIIYAVFYALIRSYVRLRNESGREDSEEERKDTELSATIKDVSVRLKLDKDNDVSADPKASAKEPSQYKKEEHK